MLFKSAGEDRVFCVHLTWSVEKDRMAQHGALRVLEDFCERWPREIDDGDDGVAG